MEENRFWNKVSFRLPGFCCAVYCVTIVFCTLASFWSGSTSFTDEGRNLMAPVTGMISLASTVLLWILSALEFMKDYRRGIICILLCVVRSAIWVPEYYYYTIELIHLACLGNFSRRKATLSAWLGGHLIYVAVLLFFLNRGLVNDVLMANQKTFLPVSEGHSFGMIHANSIGAMMLTSSIACWLLFPKQKWWLTFILFEGLAFVTLWISLSRTASILIALFPLIAMLIKGAEHLTRLKWKRLLSIIALAAPFLAVAVTFLLGWIEQMPETSLGGNFALRFRDIEVFQYAGIPFWGSVPKDIPNYPLDNVYVFLLAFMGWFPVLILLFLYALMQWKMVRDQRNELLSASILFLIYGFMEHVIIFQVYNFVPIIAFSPDTLEEMPGVGKLRSLLSN